MRRSLVAATLAAIALVPFVLTPSEADTIKAKTLTRTEDWVILKGKDFPRFKGRNKDKIRFYAQKNGALEPIPYQIDKKTIEGNYCWTEGDADKIVADPANGNIVDQDEIVFMAKDAGDLASESSFPAGQKAVHLIQLVDPRTNGTGWVYAFAFDDPPARSTRKYTWIDKKEDGTVTWHGERWMSDNAKSTWNACRMTTLKFARPEDETPDFSKSPSIIDCSKVTLRLKKWFKCLQWDSTDFYVKIGGYINGPVRVVCQSIMEFDIALGFKLRAKDSYIMTYANASTMPTNCENPIDISETPGESWYKLLMDLNSKTAKGWKFYNDKNPTAVTIDGKMDDAEKKLDKSWPDWNCVFGPEGAIIQRFTIPKEVVRNSNELYYNDDMSQEEPPEFEPGNWGCFGYKLDLSGVKAGLYTGDYVIWYCAAPYKQGDETKYLDVVDKPLTTKVK
ncbi:MAG TPA: hypothetical protein VFF73_08315 [Planctomycetota bacterium]|nr:hypothetical protein [Planctomycetota bacterium]